VVSQLYIIIDATRNKKQKIEQPCHESFVHFLNKIHTPLILKHAVYTWLECNRAWGVGSVLNYSSEKQGYKAERILSENKGENDIRTL
jgi:hypothetical protein